MEKLYDSISGMPLFAGVSGAEARRLIKNSAATVREYGAGQIVVMQGQRQNNIGVVLAGALRGVKIREDGGQTLVAQFGAGALFGEILSGAEKESPVTIAALEPTAVLSIPFDGLLSCGRDTADAAAKVIKNLMNDIADKYFALMRRVDILSIKSLRKKIAIYLCGVSSAMKCGSFESGLSRAQLAEYLNCERTALCRELSRMRDDGLISYNKGRFELLDVGALTSLAQL